MYVGELRRSECVSVSVPRAQVARQLEKYACGKDAVTARVGKLREEGCRWAPFRDGEVQDDRVVK